MPFVRFSRDRRGYEHVYLVHTPVKRGKSGRARVLYWYRSPPAAKVGREAFDEGVRRALEQQYPDLRPVDLSRDILSDARGLAAAVWPASLGWTDLDTPERLLRWRAAREAGAPRHGRRPAARAAS